jgi:predicted DNA-binding transcriptional regulator AlpA
MCNAPSIKPTRRYLNERELAEYTGIRVRTLQGWRLYGKGPPWVRFGGAVRYDMQAFERWVASQPHGGDESA